MSSSGRKKLLDPETLISAAAEVAGLAREQGVRVALVGGVAMQLYGSPRLTGDVDFAADDALEGITVSEPLSFGGVKGETSAAVPVDLIIRADRYRALYEEALLAAVRPGELERCEADIAFLLDAGKVDVVLPEYLVAMKVVAARTTDDADVEYLLGSDVIDRKRLFDLVERHLGPYAVDELARLVDELEWKKSRGR